MYLCICRYTCVSLCVCMCICIACAHVQVCTCACTVIYEISRFTWLSGTLIVPLSKKCPSSDKGVLGPYGLALPVVKDSWASP